MGEVIETGKDVQNLNTGDQVILRSDQCLGKVVKMCLKNWYFESTKMIQGINARDSRLVIQKFK